MEFVDTLSSFLTQADGIVLFCNSVCWHSFLFSYSDYLYSFCWYSFLLVLFPVFHLRLLVLFQLVLFPVGTLSILTFNHPVSRYPYSRGHAFSQNGMSPNSLGCKTGKSQNIRSQNGISPNSLSCKTGKSQNGINPDTNYLAAGLSALRSKQCTEF